MASTKPSSSTIQASTSNNTDQKTQDQMDRDAKNAARRKYDYVPEGLEPKGRLLYIHTTQDVSRAVPGAIIREWVECEKPRSEPNRGCRTGRMGLWVEKNGEFKAVLVCKRKVCDWQQPAEEGDGEEHDFAEDEAEDGGA